jgi:hypothetical protein
MLQLSSEKPNCRCGSTNGQNFIATFEVLGDSLKMDCNQACENHQDCMTFNIWGKTCELFKAVTELCSPEYVNDDIQCYYKQSWEHPS